MAVKVRGRFYVCVYVSFFGKRRAEKHHRPRYRKLFEDPEAVSEWEIFFSEARSRGASK